MTKLSEMRRALGRRKHVFLAGYNNLVFSTLSKKSQNQVYIIELAYLRISRKRAIIDMLIGIQMRECVYFLW